MVKNSGYDARRRNRNIGTDKSGRGKNNRFKIPQAWADDRMFHEKLDNPIKQTYTLGRNTFTVLVEQPRSGYCHACTPSDIEKVLKLIPSEHLEPIEMIVLRQPKRKEVIMSSVWGRLVYWSEIEGYTGPAVHLEAQEVGMSFRWPKSLTPDRTEELKRLKSDGHQVTTDRRYHHIKTNPQAVRSTQLFRTLAHEIGHYVDYLEKVENPSKNKDVDVWDRFNDLYFARPSKEREDFAHRYATEFFALHHQHGHLPFEKCIDEKALLDAGLEPAWFDLPDSMDAWKGGSGLQ